MAYPYNGPMQDMSEKIEELPEETAPHLAEVLQNQQREGVSHLADVDKRVTNTNFLTNGGGAIATLAFLGTGADLSNAKVALMLFTAGVVATGVELRSHLKYWGVLSDDASRRHRGFLNNELTVKECLVPPEIGKTYQTINHYAGWLSQICFIAGVLVGGIGFLYART